MKLEKSDHGVRRSLAGLESVTLRPSPLTFALDPPPTYTHTFALLRGRGGGGVGSRVDVRGNRRRVTDSKPASDLLTPWSLFSIFTKK